MTTGYASIFGLFGSLYFLIMIALLVLLFIFLITAIKYMKEKSMREQQLLSRMDQLVDLLERQEK